MVVGLEKFRKHFAPYADKYALIGGTACSLIMENEGLDFRSTKDLDIVLYIEVLDAEFVSTFWEFIREGEYSNRLRSTGKAIFYRFSSPKSKEYPFMIELFSRAPRSILLQKESYLTPIAVDESMVSLSAILLNEDYYQFIHQGNQIINGLPVVSVEYLIALKARAWIDIKNRSESGIAVDRKDIRKHLNDILRLSQLISPQVEVQTPSTIQDDIREFISGLEQDASVSLKNLHIDRMSKQEIVTMLRAVYGA